MSQLDECLEFTAFQGVILYRKLCLPCLQKPTDNYSQALVGWSKGNQFIYHRFFLIIGVVDL